MDYSTSSSWEFTIIPDPIYIDTPEKVGDLLKECLSQEYVAIDTETLGFKYTSVEDQVLYMGVSTGRDRRYFVPRKYLHLFQPVLSNKTLIKCFHNYKFDAHRLENSGVKVDGPIADTAIFHALIDSELPHRLDYLSDEIYGVPMAKYKDIVGKHNPMEIRPGHPVWEYYLDYGTLDALITYRLYEDLSEKLKEEKITGKRSLLDFYWRYEEPQMKALYAMERRGVKLDVDLLTRWHKHNLSEVERIQGEICKLINQPFFNKDGSGFNPGSPQQCAKLLFEVLRLPVIKKTPSGKPCADEQTLLDLQKISNNKILGMIIDYRKVEKLRGTYSSAYMKFIDQGRVHTSFNCVGTATGRLSSDKPNLQNVPSIAREIFIPDDGKIFVGADFGQLELRIIAHFSQEDSMVEAFHNNKDVHLVTVSNMNNIPYERAYEMYKAGDPMMKQSRSGSKAVIYGLSYGAGARRTSQSMSSAFGREVSLDEAQDTLDKYFAANPNVASMMKRMVGKARKKGYAQTLCGRRRRLPHIKSPERYLKAEAERAALNAPIQGTAADITKCALIRVHNDQRLKELGAELLLQIHDELILQAPIENQEAVMKIVKELMEDPFEGFKLAVPLVAEPQTAEKWSDLK